MAFTADEVRDLFKKRDENIARELEQAKRAEEEYTQARVTDVADLVHEILMHAGVTDQIMRFNEFQFADHYQQYNRRDCEVFVLPVFTQRAPEEFEAFLKKNVVALQKAFCEVEGWGGFDLLAQAEETSETKLKFGEEADNLNNLWNRTICETYFTLESSRRKPESSGKINVRIIVWTKPVKSEPVSLNTVEAIA